MKFPFGGKSDPVPEPTVDDRIQKIREGNGQMREEFIRDYTPFITKCVSKFTGSFIEVEHSDAFSIALSAFDEALRTYAPEKGTHFFSYADRVIRNRLIDDTRKNKHNHQTIPFASLTADSSDDAETPVFEPVAPDHEFERIELADEIHLLSTEMKQYGISFRELTTLCPKHQDSRQLCIRLATVIYQKPTLLAKLKKTRSLPIQEILLEAAVYRGTLERNRKYIITLVLIMESQLETLKTYLEHAVKGGGSHGA